MDHDRDLNAKITELASLPEHEIGLAKAALLIARSEYPNLDGEPYLHRLHEMAARLQSRISGIAMPTDQIEAVNRLLFVEEGFQGNRLHYHDPRNSFLNEVMDRRLGIPITLSIIYMEVAQRAGLPVYGIGFPGHFLTGFFAQEGRIVIDPFNNGTILTEDECRDMLLAQSKVSRVRSSYPDRVPQKQILVRLMRNLKALYWQMGDELKAFRMIQWILTVAPDSPAELRERGFIYQAMGDSGGAVRDLEKYLRLSPSAEDRESVMAAIETLRHRPTRVH